MGCLVPDTPLPDLPAPFQVLFGEFRQGDFDPVFYLPILVFIDEGSGLLQVEFRCLLGELSFPVSSARGIGYQSTICSRSALLRAAG